MGFSSLDERIYLSRLYDIYAPILTEKQRKVYEMHDLEDLSLSEISEVLSVSRQGVSDQLQRARDRLIEMEKTIGMVRKVDRLKDRLESIVLLLEENSGRLPSDFLEEALHLASDDVTDGEEEVTTDV